MPLRSIKPIEMNKSAKYWLVASVVVFLVCLRFTGFSIDGNRPYLGVEALLSGPLTLLVFPSEGMIWLANPILAIAWLLIVRQQYLAGLISGGGALCIAACFLLLKSVGVDESGGGRLVTGYGPGYWMWLSSIALVCVAAIIALRQQRACRAD